MQKIRLINEDCLVALKMIKDNSIDALVTDPPAGIGFMNQEWDKDKGGSAEWIAWMTEVMVEVNRVLKPGAHGLVWAIPKTSHWTAMALEQAGFEIRDCVYHIFGSGFPKNHDLSKAIDKKMGVEPTVVGQLPQTGAKFKQTQEIIDNGGFNDPNRSTYDLTEPTSDEAKQWDGYGTALKPSVECWWLIRKPPEGSLADNILKYGVGGINIKGCRVGDELLAEATRGIPKVGTFEGTDGNKTPERVGRWPSHLIMTHHNDCNNYCVPECPVGIMGDEARFFYCPKPSQSEKEEGLEDLHTTNVNDGRQTEIDNPYQRGETQRRNIHPTVKSIALMDYMIKLITPPGAKVLDPFM